MRGQRLAARRQDAHDSAKREFANRCHGCRIPVAPLERVPVNRAPGAPFWCSWECRENCEQVRAMRAGAR